MFHSFLWVRRCFRMKKYISVKFMKYEAHLACFVLAIIRLLKTVKNLRNVDRPSTHTSFKILTSFISELKLFLFLFSYSSSFFHYFPSPVFHRQYDRKMFETISILSFKILKKIFESYFGKDTFQNLSYKSTHFFSF